METPLGKGYHRPQGVTLKKTLSAKRRPICAAAEEPRSSSASAGTDSIGGNHAGAFSPSAAAALPVIVVIFSFCAFGQPYTITTVAGGALPVGIPGTSASIRTPQSVAVDAAGNVFFTAGGAVLRLDAATGILTLAAGDGTCSYSNGDGPATGATLCDARGIALDAAGNLYIADIDNNRVRKVSNGVITTVAGNGTTGFSGDSGPATSAELCLPAGVAVDAAGNLYIADTCNNRVREVSNGVITTVAGNGTRGFSGDGAPAIFAELNQPLGVAVDAAGNLYIDDYYNNRVRKVAASTGLIATVAGTGVLGYDGDGVPATSTPLADPWGVATDAAGNLYIADTSNSRIREVASGVITTVAGNGIEGYSGDGGPATGARLSAPEGVAVDSAGNLYFADTDNQRIRKISGGVITTLAGNGTPGYSGDNGPATNAQLNSPAGIAVDSAGNLYIADSGNDCIRRISNGEITTFVGSGPVGSQGETGPAGDVELAFPEGLAVDSSGSLYIAEPSFNRILKLSNGVIGTVAGGGPVGYSGDNGPVTAAELNLPSGIAVDSAGNLYIADTGNNRVREVVNGVIATVAGNGSQGYSGDNGPATAAQLNQPGGVALDSAGNLYIADTFNHRVREVVNGVITTVAGNGSQGYSGDNGPATAAQLNSPIGIALDSAGDLYIADGGNQRVRKVSGGVIATVAGNGTPGYSGDNGPATEAEIYDPYAILIDGASVYFADAFNGRIRLLSPSRDGAACRASETPGTLALAHGAPCEPRPLSVHK
jgi:sugar lactone lactonase YvrE